MTEVPNKTLEILLPATHELGYHKDLAIAIGLIEGGYNKTHSEAMQYARDMGGVPPRLGHFMHLMSTLGSLSAFDARTGSLIPVEEQEAILRDLITPTTERKEWFAERFYQEGNTWNVTYPCVESSGEIVDVTAPIHELKVTEFYARPGRLSHQGLPSASQYRVRYAPPTRSGEVAQLIANNTRGDHSTILACCTYPDVAYAERGVRSVRMLPGIPEL